MAGAALGLSDMPNISSIKKTNPKLQSIFGILTSSEDIAIRKLLESTDELLLEFAHFLGTDRAGWEGTGLELIWFPSGQIEMSSFIGAGSDGDHRVDYCVSLYPTWFYEKFPEERGWIIEANINADCQHKVYCGNMHCVYELPSVVSHNSIEAATTLHRITEELVHLGKEKPIEYWLQLAGEN